jgi:hypothetical protein
MVEFRRSPILVFLSGLLLSSGLPEKFVNTIGYSTVAGSSSYSQRVSGRRSGSKSEVH